MNSSQKIFAVCILFVFLQILYPVTGMKKRRERKRCPRVCLREISKQFNTLKLEIERLKRQVANTVAGPTGPRGPRGLKGDSGLTGVPACFEGFLKRLSPENRSLFQNGVADFNQGIRGPVGPKGEPGNAVRAKGSPSFFALPDCASDEFLTSNGKKMFCVKLDLKSVDVKDKADERQPFQPIIINPTMSPSMKDTMTIFESKSMIQSIHGDTWDVGVVQFGENFYFMSSVLGKSFSIKKWLSTRFWPMKELPVRDARNWKTFVMNGKLHLAIASNSESPSFVYQFKTESIVEEFQQIPVKNVFDVQFVQFGKTSYLVYSSIHGPTSSIYRWNEVKKRFVPHQIVHAHGTDVESFQIGNRMFLAFVAMANGPYINLYVSTSENGTFTEYITVSDVDRGYALHHLNIGEEHYLIVGKFNIEPSVILRWDGKTFRAHQVIETRVARGFASITSSLMSNGKEETYLAVVNSKSNPAIYVYDKPARSFIKLQEMESKRTRDMDFFTMGDHVYLVVSAVQNTNIYRGTIKKRP